MKEALEKIKCLIFENFDEEAKTSTYVSSKNR